MGSYSVILSVKALVRSSSDNPSLLSENGINFQSPNRTVNNRKNFEFDNPLRDLIFVSVVLPVNTVRSQFESLAPSLSVDLEDCKFFTIF